MNRGCGGFEKPQPVMSFTGFLPGNLHLVDEIPPALARDGLFDICPDGCAGPDKLRAKLKFFQILPKSPAHVYNPNSEREALVLYHVVLHNTQSIAICNL
jgi:hypothetical protein